MATKTTKKRTTAKRPVKRTTSRTSSRRKTVATEKKKDTSYLNIGIWLVVAGILLALIIYGQGQGALVKFLKDIFFGLFSLTAYLIPVVVLSLGVYVVKVRRTNNLIMKSCLSALTLALVGALIMFFWENQGEMPKVSSLWGYGTGKTVGEPIGGGLLGGSIAILLNALCGKEISIFVLLIGIAVALGFIFRVSFVELFDMFKIKKKEKEDEPEEIEEKIDGKIFKIKKKDKKDEEEEPNTVSKDMFGIIDLDDDDKKKKKTKKEEPEFNPEEFLEGVAAQLPQTEAVQELLEEEKKKIKKKVKKAEETTDEEKSQVAGEITKSIESQYENYQMPPIDLLKKVDATSSDKRREMYETANKLMSVLKDFGVEAKLLQVTQGPTVTRYEIQPSTGVKLAKITGLAEDIALNLAVPTVLVAAVPGKAAVGIEVPNNTVGTVTARELMESEAFTSAKSKLSVALGKDIGGNVVIGDISKYPHVLIAGSTGSGKSVCINTIITSILYKARPDEVKLIMVDPKVVELGMYNGIPHLLIPVVTDPKKAAGALNWAVGEMMRRYALFAETATRNLKGYNEQAEKNGTEKLPQIVIIIDELADLMMVAAKEVEDYICRLAQLARAAGIHLIIATQRPSVDVITGLIKANVPSRIAFAVSSGVDSRTILDKVGAEKLLGKGDMLYHPTGLPNAMRVQGAFVSDEEIENIIAFIKEHSEETSYAQDLADHIERMASGENGVTDEDDGDDADPLLPQAIELAAERGEVSTSIIQTKMKVGYARARRIVDQMETRGLISGANGSKPREVYLNRIRALYEEDVYSPEYEDEEESEEYDEE